MSVVIEGGIVVPEVVLYYTSLLVYVASGTMQDHNYIWPIAKFELGSHALSIFLKVWVQAMIISSYSNVQYIMPLVYSCIWDNYLAHPNINVN